MAINVQCPRCQRQLQARESFAGKRAECPQCGTQVQIPTARVAPVRHHHEPERVQAMDITDFFDPPNVTPPAAKPPKPPQPPVLERMFALLLDPRAIHWMLTIGGGLAVLGLIIWLVSIGLFDNPVAIAGILGVASLGLLGLGWWLTLRSTHRTAGRALTFLACVVLPLNLWYYQSQGLVTVDQHLWVGGLVCLLLYMATVKVLKDPLFVYAVECGVTLTALLLAADLNLLTDLAHWSVLLAGLAAISIHAERVFGTEGEYRRDNFGLPLFWCGQGQLAAALLLLLGSQCVGWLVEPLGLTWPGNLLTRQSLLAGGIWLGGMYLYFYSDLVVRRHAIYSYLAGLCLLMAEVTLLLPHLGQEMLIVALAVTALVIEAIFETRATVSERLRKQAGAVSMLLSLLPLVLGVILHFRAVVGEGEADYETGWKFLMAMVVVTLTNRIAAWLVRHTNPDLSLMHFIFSMFAAVIAAAGLLRVRGLETWMEQAPLLMLLPIGYIVAARFWRDRSPERPLAIVSHICTVLILLGTFASALQMGERFLIPVVKSETNLWLGVTFLEAAVFYVLAGIFRSKSWNAYFAAVAASAALWQFLGYFDVAGLWHPAVFAALGIGVLLLGRFLGLEEVDRYDRRGQKFTALRGRGLTAFQCGNGLLSVALVMAILQALSRLFESGLPAGQEIVMMLSMTGISLAAWLFLSRDGWRKWYGATTIALGVLDLQLLNQFLDLTGLQKLELFTTLIGLLILVYTHIELFREKADSQDSVSFGLWVGSFLAIFPVLVATLHYRFFTDTPSLYDELALLTITVILLVLGCSWQIKATTLLGGSALALYLVLLIGSLAYHPQVAIGVYLLIGGGLLFACGLGLSLYRDRLIRLPEQLARREGIFRVINWR